jgi:DNA-binding NarL/FixJ family response regulator
MSKYRILIADDHEVVRQGLRALVEAHSGWEVCAEASDGWQAVAKCAALKPDVVALDIGMPNLNGLDAARQILRNDPRQKILIVTIYESEDVGRAAIEAGARGVLLKSEAARELMAALEALQHNSYYFRSQSGVPWQHTLRDGRQSQKKHALTRRERQVIQLLAEGKSTKEVATLLDLSVKTAETHRSNIMGKLGLHSVSELVLYAVRNQIVQAINPMMATNETQAAFDQASSASAAASTLGE